MKKKKPPIISTLKQKKEKLDKLIKEKLKITF